MFICHKMFIFNGRTSWYIWFRTSVIRFRTSCLQGFCHLFRTSGNINTNGGDRIWHHIAEIIRTHHVGMRWILFCQTGLICPYAPDFKLNYHTKWWSNMYKQVIKMINSNTSPTLGTKSVQIQTVCAPSTLGKQPDTYLVPVNSIVGCWCVAWWCLHNLSLINHYIICITAGVWCSTKRNHCLTFKQHLFTVEHHNTSHHHSLHALYIMVHHSTSHHLQSISVVRINTIKND